MSENSRSEWVKAILEVLEASPRKWISNDELIEAAAPFVTHAQAEKVYALRVKGEHSKAERIRRGKRLQIMLATITLAQYGKILQRGKGKTKQFKMA